jgi:hypothetical protein
LPAGGGHEINVRDEAPTVRDPLRALPVAVQLVNGRGEWNECLNLHVDRTDAQRRGDLEYPLVGPRVARIFACRIAGG